MKNGNKRKHGNINLNHAKKVHLILSQPRRLIYSTAQTTAEYGFSLTRIFPYKGQNRGKICVRESAYSAAFSGIS